MLDHTVAILRAALDRAAQSFLDDTLHFMRRGLPLLEAAETAAGNVERWASLKRGVAAGWQTAWTETGLVIIARLKAKRSREFAQLASDPLPRLPSDYRTFEETHPPGGPNVSRATWEWLAEHEATLQQTIPREYVERYLTQRVPPLAGVTDRALLSATSQIAAGIAQRGFGVRESMQALRRQFPAFTDHRLENIARTEGAQLYETGRLARYYADAAVSGVRYDAIGDGRTTEICRALDGRVWRLGDPNLVSPPSHYMCRSTLAPVLFDEEPNWETGPPPPEGRPLSGFGRISPQLLPENVTIGQASRSGGVAHEATKALRGLLDDLPRDIAQRISMQPL